MLPLVLVLGGCVSHVDRMKEFRQAYSIGDVSAAEAALDAIIADEAGVDPLLVSQSAGLSEEIDPLEGETHLLLLEKAMTRLASGDVDSSSRLLDRARSAFDAYYRTDFSDFWEEAEATFVDDAAITYSGADYEHIVLRTMQALIEFVRGGPDLFPYTLQIEEKQREILESTAEIGTSEEGEGYNPRSQYQRVPIGLYLMGVLAEEDLKAERANEHFREALAFTGGSRLLDEAVARSAEGVYSPPGHGAVHVLYLAGRGPTLIESTDVATELAKSIASVGVAIISESPSALVQAPVPVPAVQVNDPAPVPLAVTADDGTATSTEPLLDLNVVAQQQLDANMPIILARAVVRRTVKAAAAAVVEEQMGGNDDIFGILSGMAANMAMTAGERADTRLWMSLPAQIQAARLTVPAGRHELTFGDGTRLPVQVSAGHSTVVLAIRPALDRPARCVVDEGSRIELPAEPVPEVEAPPASTVTS
jgi:hypothetical protein